MENSDFVTLTIDPGAKAETLPIADLVAIAIDLQS